MEQIVQPETPTRLSQPLSVSRLFLAIIGIYITQSLMSTLAMQSIPALVRAAGGSLAWVGASTLFMLPWAIKFLWSPFVERGRLPNGKTTRRSRLMILTGQCLLVVILLACSAFGIGAGKQPLLASLQWVLMLLFAGALIASTIDIACDGFCVDQLATQNYGWGNVAQVGGSYLGMMAGGGLFLLAVNYFGWSGATLCLAGVIILLTLPLWWIKEPERDEPLQHRPSLRYALQRPETRYGIVLIVVLNIGVRVVLPFYAPLLLDHGLSMAQVGTLFTTGSVVAGVLGTLCGGVLIRVLGLWRALWVAYALQGFMLIGFAVSLYVTKSGLLSELLRAGVMLQFGVTACAMVCSYSVLMRWSSPLQAGVDFTLFQCADAGIAIVSGTFGGLLASQLGYAVSFTCAAALTFFGAWLSFILRNRLQVTHLHLSRQSMG